MFTDPPGARKLGICDAGPSIFGELLVPGADYNKVRRADSPSGRAAASAIIG
jgi:hypothetical protein